MLDKRGTGLSDRVREVQSIEATMRLFALAANPSW
jgi:hypothetical protein